MIVFKERKCILQFYIVNFPGKLRKYFEITFGQISGVSMKDLWNRNNIPRKFHVSPQGYNNEGGTEWATGCTTEQTWIHHLELCGIISVFSLAPTVVTGVVFIHYFFWCLWSFFRECFSSACLIVGSKAHISRIETEMINSPRWDRPRPWDIVNNVTVIAYPRTKHAKTASVSIHYGL